MPEEYEVVLEKAALAAFGDLDKSDRILVVKQLEKLKRSPELGDLLGNKSGLDLAGYRKVYAAKKRIRIIYAIEQGRLVVSVIAIGPRADAQVYQIASVEAKKRLKRIGGVGG